MVSSDTPLQKHGKLGARLVHWLQLWQEIEGCNAAWIAMDDLELAIRLVLARRSDQAPGTPLQQLLAQSGGHGADHVLLPQPQCPGPPRVCRGQQQLLRDLQQATLEGTAVVDLVQLRSPSGLVQSSSTYRQHSG